MHHVATQERENINQFTDRNPTEKYHQRYIEGGSTVMDSKAVSQEEILIFTVFGEHIQYYANNLKVRSILKSEVTFAFGYLQLRKPLVCTSNIVGFPLPASH